MLTKLIKYECKTTWGVLWPVAVGVFGLSTLAALLGCARRSIPALDYSTSFFVINVVVTMLGGLGIFAAMVACFLVIVSRFYRLLGEEGYLMLSLPATPFQHIAAKLSCALLTTVMAFAVSGICGGLMAAGNDAFEMELGGYLLNDIPWLFYGLLVLLVCGASAFLFIYLCIAIAGHWPQQRLLASIIIYFVLTFVAQVVFFIVVILAVGCMMGLAPSWHIVLSDASGNAVMATILAMIVLIPAGLDAILWAVTQHLMTKQLNLP